MSGYCSPSGFTTPEGWPLPHAEPSHWPLGMSRAVTACHARWPLVPHLSMFDPLTLPSPLIMVLAWTFLQLNHLTMTSVACLDSD